MPNTGSQPWLKNKKWRKNQIRSNAKLGVFVAWAFAIVWNLISAPILFDSPDLLSKLGSKPENLFVLAFPLMGLVLIVVAIRSFKNWARFGPTPLVMDPWPGSIGGHVGGVVNNSVPFSPEHRYLVTLSCMHSYMSGSGKNRTRKESVTWQTEGVCFSEARHGLKPGTKVSFRFGVPDHLPESDVVQSGSYYLWRLSIGCDLPGTDFDRAFEIPVFRVGKQQSVELTLGTEAHHLTADMAHEGVQEIAEVRPIPGGMEFYYPAFKRPASGIFASIFGAVFMGIGVFMSGVEDVPFIFPFVFTPIGLGILSYGLWDLGKSLRVKLSADYLYTRRFFMGYPMTSRQLRTDQVRALDIKEGVSISSGNKTTVYYSLLAKTSDGKKLVLAERFKSKPEVELIKETIEGYCPALRPKVQ